MARFVSGFSSNAVGYPGFRAHPMTPFLGQGGCQAIEDAVTLGHLFAAVREGRLDEASLAASYERRRKSRVDPLAATFK